MKEAELRQAMDEALARRDRPAAVRALLDWTRQDPNCAEAWLGLASLATDVTRKRYYLGRVLTLDPDNQAARREFGALGGHEALVRAGVPAELFPGFQGRKLSRAFGAGTGSRTDGWTFFVTRVIIPGLLLCITAGYLPSLAGALRAGAPPLWPVIQISFSLGASAALVLAALIALGRGAAAGIALFVAAVFGILHLLYLIDGTLPGIAVLWWVVALLLAVFRKHFGSADARPWPQAAGRSALWVVGAVVLVAAAPAYLTLRWSESPAPPLTVAVFDDDFSAPVRGLTELRNGPCRFNHRAGKFVVAWDSLLAQGGDDLGGFCLHGYDFGVGRFNVEVDVGRLMGDSQAGLVFGHRDFNNYYGVVFSRTDRTCWLWKVWQGRDGNLVNGVDSELIHLPDADGAAWDRLRLEVEPKRSGAATFRVYANGKLFKTVDDSSYTGGRIGFVGGSREGDGMAAFDNLHLESLD